MRGNAPLIPRTTNISALNGSNFGVLMAGVIQAMKVSVLVTDIKAVKKNLALNS